jgi:hypothetical protein
MQEDMFAANVTTKKKKEYESDQFTDVPTTASILTLSHFCSCHATGAGPLPTTQRCLQMLSIHMHKQECQPAACHDSSSLMTHSDTKQNSCTCTATDTCCKAYTIPANNANVRVVSNSRSMLRVGSRREDATSRPERAPPKDQGPGAKHAAA